MEEVLEYELLNIEWDLNYEFDQETPVRMVCDDSGEQSSEKEDKLRIVYDENGIPMGSSLEEIKLRQQIIFEFYEQWKSAHPEKAVYNKSLQADILIRKESVVEAAAHASKRYKSTLAVLKLDEVLANAVKVAVDSTKAGNKNQSKLMSMILMSHLDVSIGKIKLTVGVRKSTQDKIQYGISALENGESIVPMVGNKNKKKAPHKK